MPNLTVRASATALPNSSRRLFLAAGTAAAVCATLKTAVGIAYAGAQPVDPIFAAIERHKTAWRAFSDACGLTDEVLAEEEGREVTEADEAAHNAAEEAERDAFYEAIGMAPVTVAGMRALLEYAIELEDGGGEVLWIDLGATLLKSPVLRDGDADGEA